MPITAAVQNYVAELCGVKWRPPTLQHAMRVELMAVDQLTEKIGAVPQGSAHHENLIAALAESRKKISVLEDKPLAELSGNRSTILEDIAEPIERLMASASAYEDEQDEIGDDEKQEAAWALHEAARRYLFALPKNLDLILDDPCFGKIAGHATVGQALAAKIRGIAFADCEFADYNGSTLDAGNSVEQFGSGSSNTVARLVHRDGTPRVFKPELDRYDPDRPFFSVLVDAGIPPRAPNFGNRSIASRLVSEFLGAEVMPEACFALHQGRIGLLMDLAKGRPTVGEKAWMDWPDQAGAERMGPARRKDLLIEQHDGRWASFARPFVKPWTAPLSPDAQAGLLEQLNRLEWTDMGTGELDRHRGNIFIDIQGDQVKVTGVDNEFCFGDNQDKLVDGSRASSPGPARLIDAKLYGRLMDGDLDAALLSKLSGLLTGKAIAATRDRFEAMRQRARSLSPDYVVADWRTWRTPGPPPNLTAAEFLAAQDGPNLFKRDIVRFLKEDGLL